jgi:hypothetical protein
LNDLLLTLLQLAVMTATLCGQVGARADRGDLLLKMQLIGLSRAQQLAPNPTLTDRYNLAHGSYTRHPPRRLLQPLERGLRARDVILVFLAVDLNTPGLSESS